MKFWQFVVAELFFFGFWFLAMILAVMAEGLTYYVTNIFTFFTAAWVIALVFKNSSYADLLGAAIGFNLLTYLLDYALFRTPLPELTILAMDFAFILLLTLAGAWVGKKH